MMEPMEPNFPLTLDGSNVPTPDGPDHAIWVPFVKMPGVLFVAPLGTEPPSALETDIDDGHFINPWSPAWTLVGRTRPTGSTFEYDVTHGHRWAIAPDENGFGVNQEPGRWPEVYLMIGWQSTDRTVRLIAPRVIFNRPFFHPERPKDGELFKILLAAPRTIDEQAAQWEATQRAADEAAIAEMAARVGELGQQIKLLTEAQDEAKAQLREVLKVGTKDRYGNWAVRIGQATRFNRTRAIQVLPPEILTLITVTTTEISEDRAKELLTPVQFQACRMPYGKESVTVEPADKKGAPHS